MEITADGSAVDTANPVGALTDETPGGPLIDLTGLSDLSAELRAIQEGYKEEEEEKPKTKAELRKEARSAAREARREERAKARAECEAKLQAYAERTEVFKGQQQEWRRADEAFKDEMKQLQIESQRYEEAKAEREQKARDESERKQTDVGGGNPWNSLLYTPDRMRAMRKYARLPVRNLMTTAEEWEAWERWARCGDGRAANQVESVILTWPLQQHLTPALECLKAYSMGDLGTEFYISEENFCKALDERFFSELNAMEATQLFWCLSGKLGLTDGFLKVSALCSCLCEVLNSGRRLERALAVYERLCSPQELMRHRMRKAPRPKGKKKRHAGQLDLKVQVDQAGIESVARGDSVGGKQNEPHPNRALLAKAALAIPTEEGGLPFKEGKLAMIDFVVALKNSQKLFGLFVGPLLDAYLRVDFSPGGAEDEDI